MLRGKVDPKKEEQERLQGFLLEMLKEEENKVSKLLRRVANFMCGGHYEPRNDEEGQLAKEIFNTVGIS